MKATTIPVASSMAIKSRYLINIFITDLQRGERHLPHVPENHHGINYILNVIRIRRTIFNVSDTPHRWRSPTFDPATGRCANPNSTDSRSMKQFSPCLYGGKPV
jgi:hypothetical protein